MIARETYMVIVSCPAAGRKMSLLYALDILMMSCRFCS